MKRRALNSIIAYKKVVDVIDSPLTVETADNIESQKLTAIVLKAEKEGN